MTGFCLLGAGRIGRVHAANIIAHPTASLRYVVDADFAAAEALARRHSAVPLDDPATALADDAVRAVVIGTPTDTHLDMVAAAAAAGKAILCEKPIDLDIDRVDRCLDIVARHGIPFAVGFNRRFDPTLAALRRAVRAGEIGEPEMMIITSRDPAPPPARYFAASGGYFCDSTIHDLDLARWVLGEEPIEVFAMASCLIDPAIGATGDVDTAMTVLRTASGRLCHINNSRRAVYGFDQRVEVFGAKGMLQTENQREIGLTRATATGTDSRPPLKHFYLERYAESFARELDDFVEAIGNGRAPAVTPEDGRRALTLALACERSRREGRAVAP
ncbi:MAG: inositol 2-dehydrogenase [Azospirillaceae bacterium]